MLLQQTGGDMLMYLLLFDSVKIVNMCLETALSLGPGRQSYCGGSFFSSKKKWWELVLTSAFLNIVATDMSISSKDSG